MNSLPIIEMALINAAKSQEHFDAIEAAGPIFAHYDTAYATAKHYLETYTYPAPLDALRAIYEHWEATEGEFQYWFDMWIPARRIYAFRRAVGDAFKRFDENPDDADIVIRQFIENAQSIAASGSIDVHHTDELIEERYAKYKFRSERSQRSGFSLWGIPTGFTVIDSTRQGWMPGELVGFFSRPTVGKTWLLLRLGVIAWMSNRSVLLITPEMPAEQISYRLDALMAGHLGIPFSHKRALSGDPAIDAHYQALAERIRGNERWWTISDIGGRSLSVSDIASLTARFNPDLVLVDGVSLLSDDQRGKQEWERMKNVCYDLKRFATASKASVITSHQSVNSRRGSRSNRDAAQGRGDDWIMPSLNDSAYGDAFVQACSTIFTLAPDVDNPGIRWYSIRKTREREIPFEPRLAMGWDVDRGIIVDLGKWGSDIIQIQAALRSHGIGLPVNGHGAGVEGAS